MHVDIRRTDGSIPAGLREHLERRLHFTLARFSDQATRATVYLSDLNGPRGGLDKHCRIALTLRRGGAVVCETTGECWAEALDRAGERARRSLLRELDRGRRSSARPARALTLYT